MKVIVDLSVFYQIFSSYMNDLCKIITRQAFTAQNRHQVIIENLREMKNFPKRFVQSIWLYASKYLIARQSAHGFEKNLLYPIVLMGQSIQEWTK